MGELRGIKLGDRERRVELERLLAATERELRAAEQRVCDFQAAAMIDVGNQGGPCCVEPIHVERHVLGLRAALARAEAERDRARAVLRDIEWDGPPVSVGVEERWSCPCCGGAIGVGHTEDCELAAEIRPPQATASEGG